MNSQDWMQADDAAVTSMLRGELARLQRATSYEALRLAEGASQSQIRAAFLRDTKRFHPNRFARRSRQVSKLANEVFLLIKEAYYDLAGSRAGAIRSAGSGSPRPMRSPVAVTQRATEHRRSVGYRTGPMKAITDDVTGERNAIVAGQRRRASTSPGATQRQSSPAIRPPGPRTSSPNVTDVRTGRRRAATHPGATRTEQPQARRAGQSSPDDATVADGLVRALQLAETQKWHEAMTVLQGLFQSNPRDRRIQAYAHFIRGREYESVGNLDNARAEYERVLGIDPTLEAAQRALNHLNNRGIKPRK